MNKSKITKRALLLSLLSLVVCMTLLIGSTYAWFTDTATSAGNTIVSGTLEVDLVDSDDNSLAGQVLEWKTADDRSQNTIYWEPGCTYETEDVFVENKGNLALKYKLYINGINGDAKLLEVIDWKVEIGGVEIDLSTFEGRLEPKEKSSDIVLIGHMLETANNDYQNLIAEGISISVHATQATSENDSYGNTYDELAELQALKSQLEESAKGCEPKPEAASDIENK